MKKYLSIAALLLAFTPLVQAQNHEARPSGHTDARHDRHAGYNRRGTMAHHDHDRAKHERRAIHRQHASHRHGEHDM